MKAALTIIGRTLYLGGLGLLVYLMATDKVDPSSEEALLFIMVIGLHLIVEFKGQEVTSENKG